MLKRVITGTVATLIFIPICIFSDYVVFPIVLSILSVIGVFEMAKCLGHHKNLVLTIPMYLIAAALPLLRFYLIPDVDSTLLGPYEDYYFFSIAIATIFFMLIYTLAYVMLRKNKDKLSDILTFYALFVYIVGCFSSIACVRYFRGDTGNMGKYIYALIFLGAWICDTFAYFTGRLLGKHKLIPDISPKKTIEGSIGGIVFTIISFVIYGLIVNKVWDDEIQLSYVLLVIMGFVASIISQIGDLIASAIKRQYDIKDYGNLFPGHGGVLDRFDSVMLVAPMTYIVFYIASII